MAAASLELGVEEFELLFEAAAQACGHREYCSLDAFLRCRHEALARRSGL